MLLVVVLLLLLLLLTMISLAQWDALRGATHRRHIVDLLSASKDLDGSTDQLAWLNLKGSNRQGAGAMVDALLASGVALKR